MSFWTQEIIETLYRLLSFLANVPLAKRLIISNKYEYDYTVLAPLAMTSVPPSIISYLPQLPTADELPKQKWLSLVLSTLALGVFAEIKKSTASSDNSVSNENEIDSNKINLLKSIDEEIKAAKGQEDLTNAVLKLKSVLGIGITEQPRPLFPDGDNELEVGSNISKIQDRFDAIDREVRALLRQGLQPNLPEPPTFLKPDELDLNSEEVEEVDKELYRHLQEIARFLGRKLEKNQPKFSEQAETTVSTPNPTLEDYEQLTEPLKIKPETLSNFQQDKVFAYMQVAGPNPVMLNQIAKLDSRLLITNEQYQNIVSQDSLDAALGEGRLYLADYSKLGALINGSYGGLQKYIYAPVALFAVPPDNYSDRNLLPIAICCQQTSGEQNPIFTPLDGDNWITAKTILQMADSNYHELISHLAQTHLFVEPFVLATNRCFTDKNHAVRLLLKPHLEGTILINYGAHKYLLAPGGSIDSLLGATIGSDCQLAIKEAQTQLANFNQVAFPRTLEKRGVNNSQQLPIYPYRDDGQRIWDAIFQWVKDYLGLFYASDTSVESDAQLQNWAGELFSKGYCHIGEEGDGRIKTLDYLVEAISTIIFTASAQHAAVNFPQSGLMTYVPAFPLGCYSPGLTNPKQQQNFMSLLPPLKRAELQVQVLYLLGSVYYTQLGDYSGSSFQNPQVKIALDKFNVNLAEIEQIILKADSQRLVSYRYLLPSKIPQSINI